MVYRLIVGFLLYLISLTSFCQVDKEFWFAAPYANPTNGRTPVYLRFQSFSVGSTITIDIPANTGFSPLSINIGANSSYSLNVTTWLNQIECIPANTILNKGLHIVSTNEISVYYEIYGTSTFAPGTNSDLFTLKGRNALGTEFFTPFQTRWDNYTTINAWATFDIIATENNTEITITPTKPIVGHAATIPFTIILNKGETWSGQSFFIEAGNRPTGSYIKSNKPIAVTIKDDSMFDIGNWDIGGDQLIPITQLGVEYIVINHTSNVTTQNNFAYVLATENNTNVYLNGGAIPTGTINKGEQIEVEIIQTTYIQSDKPVYVLHVTGFGNELAAAILPQIICTGSKSVGFIRSNSEDLVLNILTKQGHEGSFQLNGSNTLVKSSDFSIVPGTTNWMFASIPYTIAQIPALRANLLTNTTGYFHLGLMNGLPDNTGFRYGYFSDFGFTDIGKDTIICSNTTIELSAGIQKDSYLWSPTGETTSKIIARDSGTYSVIVTKETCAFKDTIHISYYPKTTEIIKNKTEDSTCANVYLTINSNTGFTNYLWSTGATSDSIQVSTSNRYTIIASDIYGCINYDTITITALPIPSGNINYSPANNQTFCASNTIALTAPPNYKSYLWQNGNTNQSQQTTKSSDGMYWVILTDSLTCSNTIYQEVDCSIYITIYNLITPNGDGKNDYFYIENLQENTYALKIYNRWGNLVYSNDNYNNVWDAEPLDDGLYYYSLTHYKNSKNFKSWLHVLR
jgi:gliding motility-associated-like protein